MKLKDFIKQLLALPEDLEVVMSKDGEGNGFSPFADFSLNMYAADSTWSGELKDPEEMQDDEYKINAVVLWPTN